jgi:hypothetical protein
VPEQSKRQGVFEFTALVHSPGSLPRSQSLSRIHPGRTVIAFRREHALDTQPRRDTNGRRRWSISTAGPSRIGRFPHYGPVPGYPTDRLGGEEARRPEWRPRGQSHADLCKAVLADDPDGENRIALVDSRGGDQEQDDARGRRLDLCDRIAKPVAEFSTTWPFSTFCPTETAG